jgi:hydrogenase expression/formation protein HypD
VIIGADAFSPIVEEFGLSCVITGFEGPQIAAALARLSELTLEARAALENLYPQAVTPLGNTWAWELIERVFEPADVYWRGLAELPNSGLQIRDAFTGFDARARYQLQPAENHEPTRCRCGEVITGRCTPVDCTLFGNACTPIRAIGPCMVSSEGTCQAWFKFQRLAHREPTARIEVKS